MRLYSLKDRTVININTGERMASAASCDFEIDEDNGRIEAMLIPQGKMKMLFSNEPDYLRVPWEKITKIGVDTIMINL